MHTLEVLQNSGNWNSFFWLQNKEQERLEFWKVCARWHSYACKLNTSNQSQSTIIIYWFALQSVFRCIQKTPLSIEDRKISWTQKSQTSALHYIDHFSSQRMVHIMYMNTNWKWSMFEPVLINCRCIHYFSFLQYFQTSKYLHTTQNAQIQIAIYKRFTDTSSVYM